MYFAAGSELLYFFKAALTLELIFFSFYTLLLISRRKRKIADVTIRFFRLSLAALLLTIVLWWLFELFAERFPQLAVHSDFIIGILLIYGFAISAIMGMLQKIVPFLIYLNLQKLSFKHPDSMSVKPRLIANMKELINARQSTIQLRLHFSSLVLLLVSLYLLPVVWLAGVLMLADFLWLSYVLFNAFTTFLNNKKQIVQFPEMKMDSGL